MYYILHIYIYIYTYISIYMCMYVSIWLCIGNILSSFLLWIPSMNKQKPHDICTYLSIWLASWLSCTPTLSRHSLSYLKPALHPKLSSFFHRQGWKSDLSFWNILPKFTFFLIMSIRHECLKNSCWSGYESGKEGYIQICTW